MKKIILLFQCLVITIGLFSQSNPTQATIKKTGPWTVTIYAKPQSNVNSSDISLNFSISVLGTSGDGPIMGAPNTMSLIPGSSLQQFGTETIGSRRVYPFQIQFTPIPPATVNFTGGIDNPIAQVTFPPLPAGQKGSIQLNDYTGSGTSWCYWYISHSNGDQTPYASMFYGNMPVNVNGGDSRVNIDQPLPVKLLSFGAEKSGEKNAHLNWSSASEINSNYFAIERSFDKVKWSEIGKVNAAGNSQIVTNYQYMDVGVYNGVASQLNVHYRLRMVDIDGTFEYSPIETVNFGKSQSIVNSREFLVYPNPASEGVHIQWDANQVDQPTSLEFYDLSGKLVLVEPVPDQTNQQYVDFTKSTMGTGLYLLRIMNGDQPIEHKQIVVGQH